MSRLIAEILADYGTIPQRIGGFLRRRNGSCIGDIMTHASLSHIQTVQGLSLMIQRRFVKYFQYERQTYYSLDMDIVHRRMFYPIYVEAAEAMFGTEAADMLMSILIGGFVKVEQGEWRCAELIERGVVVSVSSKGAGAFTTISKEPGELRLEARVQVDVDSERKSRRIDDGGFWIVDFGVLDSILADARVAELVRRRYSSEAENVYRVVLRSTMATPESILEHLGGGARSEVVSHLKYLENARLVKKSLDGTEAYFRDGDGAEIALAVECLNRILSANGVEPRRLFNMMVEHGVLEDKDIALRSLLASHVVKRALFMLHSNGFVVLKYSPASDARPVLLWEAKISHTSRVVGEEIKRKLGDGWRAVNRRWTYGWMQEEPEDEELREIERIVGLAHDLFILRG